MATIKFWQITDPFGDPLQGVFPAAALVKHLKQLDYMSRRYDTPDGWRLYSTAVGTNSNPHFALHRIRHDDLPAVEQSGELSELDLEDDQNLAEATHFMFFPRNVVVQLYNHDGPGISRLGQYMQRHLGLGVGVAPVLRRDAAKTLGRLKDVSQVSMAIPVDNASLLEGDSPDETIDAIKHMAEVSSSKTLYVKATIWGSSDPHASTKWMKVLKAIVGSERFDAFTKLKVRGRDTQAGGRQTLDLIAEQLAMTEEVEYLSETSRAIKNSSASTALADAYSAMESDVLETVPKLPKNAPVLTLKELRATDG